jgi:hypothetical protein
MTEQQTLTEFLEARLKEDFDLAAAVANDSYGEDCWFDTGNEHIATHYLRHGTERVLREVTAKRAILRDHLEDHAPEHDCVQNVNSLDAKYSGCYVVVQLASMHSDHPDFDPHWSTT